MQQFRFDAALSFAGAQRSVARRLRNELSKLGMRVFLDEDFEHEMLGTDGQAYLRRVYGHESALCVVLISEDYDHRAWTQLEREIIQSRELRGERDVLIPVLIDSYSPAWLPAGRIYYDASTRSLPALARLLMRRITRTSIPRSQKSLTSAGTVIAGKERSQYTLLCRQTFIHGFFTEAKRAEAVLPGRASQADPISIYVTEGANDVLYAQANVGTRDDPAPIKVATNETRDLRVLACLIADLETDGQGFDSARAGTAVFLCDSKLLDERGELRVAGADLFRVRIVSPTDAA